MEDHTLVGIRFTHSAESRYAPIESEALAVADALGETRFFVLGCVDFIIAVDHKPLLKVFSNRTLDEITNTRLRNLKEKISVSIQDYSYPWAKHKAADAMSLYPSGSKTPKLFNLPDDIATIDVKHLFLRCIRRDEIVSSITDIDNETIESAFCSLNALTSSDTGMNLLLSAIEESISKFRHKLPSSLREYHRFREDLYTVDGVIYSLRVEVLSSLQVAHQCVTSTTSRAEASVFWPGITSPITATRATCAQCNRMAPSQSSAPPTPTILPSYPFQCICANFFTYKGVSYLCIVDRSGGWLSCYVVGLVVSSLGFNSRSR